MWFFFFFLIILIINKTYWFDSKKYPSPVVLHKWVLSVYVSFSLVTALPTVTVSRCGSLSCGMALVKFFCGGNSSPPPRLSLLVFIQPVSILHIIAKVGANLWASGKEESQVTFMSTWTSTKGRGKGGGGWTRVHGRWRQQRGERGGRWFRGSLSELMMLLAAVTKASLTCTNAKVLPSPWASGFDFLGCRPPPAHSDHSKEKPRRRSLGQRRVFSGPVSLWLRGYINRNVASSSDNEPHYPACVNVYTRVTSEKKKKSGSTNSATCASMCGWIHGRQMAWCTLRFFVRANSALLSLTTVSLELEGKAGGERRGLHVRTKWADV